MRTAHLASLVLLASAAVAQPPTDAAFVDVADVSPEVVGGMAALSRAVVYPDGALEAGVEGTVVVRFVVGTDGAVAQAEAVRSPDEALSRAALAAVRAQRFTPGQVGGEPVRVRMVVPIRFRLPGPDRLAPRPPGALGRPASAASGPVTAPISGPGEVYEWTETQPELIGGLAALAPDYPDEARRNGIQGRVVVQFVVDETGRPVDLEVLSSPHPLLSWAALDAVRDARFVPGTVDGRPVKVQLATPLTFRLR